MFFRATPPSTGKAAAGQAGGKGCGKGAGKGGGRFGGDPNRVQPVAVAAARKGDINIVQTALGTVTALRTVDRAAARRRPAAERALHARARW